MTNAMSVSEAKGQLGSIIDRAHLQHETVFLTRRGKRVVAVVDADEYERILELAEDAEDIAAADAALAEIRAGAPTHSWEDVKKELGLA